MRNVLLGWCVAVAVVAVGCSSSTPPASAPPPSPTTTESAGPSASASGSETPPPAPSTGGDGQTGPRLGGDRDSHGCIGSAGYRWCQRENQCVRPWELAASRGIAFDADATANGAAIERYCSGP